MRVNVLGTIRHMIRAHNPHFDIVYLIQNWASEASPTLGCSIEISRDISRKIFSTEGAIYADISQGRVLNI